MKRQITLTLLVAACMLYAQAAAVPSDDVTDIKEINPGLQNNPALRAGYHNASGYYFYVNRETQMTWVEATKSCNILNMGLLSFETQQKYEAIGLYLVLSDISSNYWTSGQKVLDTFIWTGSGQAFTNTNWQPGEPNEVSSDVCVSFEYLFGWYDYPCDTRRPYICE